MIRETVTDKVRKLIALASSPHVEEARSAAFKAASLIREFNLDIIDPATRDTDESKEWPRWVVIISRYRGRCLSCEDSYDKGERIQWKRSVGCIHIDCERPD